MKIDRRRFLEGAVLGAGGLLLGCQPEASAPAAARPAKAVPPTHFDPAEIVPLGKTKIRLSRVGAGTGMRGGRRESNQTRLGKKGFETLIRGAYDRGVRWFDLADSYGSHPFFATSLKGIPRDNYVVISKMWLHRRGGLPERERPDADIVLQRFLKELNSDYIDLILMHCMWSAEWPRQFRRQMDILAKLKQKGLIRAHGVSCHSLGALEAAAGEPWVDSIHARINPYGAVMDGPPEKVAPVLKRAHDAGKGVVGMKLIGEGQFRDSGEMRDKAVDYVLNLGCVDTMVVGFESLAEVDDFTTRVGKVRRSAAGT
jgi:aryl-alcohol dehydrogenase-like predicted oxidoreductase